MITSGDISTGQAMVDKGKQTTQAGADKAEDELSAEEDESSRTLDVLFNVFQNQHYGFDGQYGQSALQPQYETLTHKDGTYHIAWKSVRKGATGQVVVKASPKIVALKLEINRYICKNYKDYGNKNKTWCFKKRNPICFF